MTVLREGFTGQKIPTASQRCAALSAWLRHCSGSSVEVHVEPGILQMFQGMRDLVQQTNQRFKRGSFLYHVYATHYKISGRHFKLF